MTSQKLHEYLKRLLGNQPLDARYIPRRFTALPESGSISSDLEIRSRGFLREREPQLEELLTHPAIAIVADPGGGKSIVGRAAVHQLAKSGQRVPVFVDVKQYRGDLPSLLRLTTPAEVLKPESTVDADRLKRTYIFDGIDEVPSELLQAFGRELRGFISNKPHALCLHRPSGILCCKSRSTAIGSSRLSHSAAGGREH